MWLHFFLITMLAADWLTVGGNPSRDNWQSREKGLAPENVKGLKLLWKRELPGGPLTAPVILGPIITHRGIKELVFVETASNEILAIDADLGRTFWTRKLDSGPACAGSPLTPVITPEKVRAPEDGEGHTPLRPIYFAAADGTVHKIIPTTGEDMEPASGNCGTPLQIAPFVPLGTTKYSLEGRDIVSKEPLATWVDSTGSRWIYRANAEGLLATIASTGSTVWIAPALGLPVIANGMLFALGTGGAPKLNALDAKTGKLLSSSSENLPTAGRASTLALANGHICFTSTNALYCFGLPLEI